MLPADGLRLRWDRRLAMDPEEAAEAVGILRPRVAIPVLDHDFSRSIAGLLVKTTGSVDEFQALARRRYPAVDTPVLKPGCR